MKALNQTEVELIGQELNGWCGYILQEVQPIQGGVCLIFWGKGRLHSLILDMNKARPVAIPIMDSGTMVKSKSLTPSVLFLRSHFKNLVLSKAEVLSEFGRVIKLWFKQDFIEIHLIPHATNMLLQHEMKKIFWQKPKELIAQSQSQAYPNPRTLSAIFQEWSGSKVVKSKVDPEAEKNKVLKKIEKAMTQVKSQIERLKPTIYKDLGLWLQANQNLSVPSEFIELVDEQQSLSWNIQKAFDQSKTQLKSLDGKKQRLVELKQEFEHLSAQDSNHWYQDKKKSKKEIQRSGEQKKPGKIFRIGGFEVGVGRNARENLALLRCARAWDFWFHLQDYPGSHAILFRNKNQKLSDAIMAEIGGKLVRQSFKSNLESQVDLSFDMLINEVRFVRPIKGDKLGRVTHQNSQVFQFRFKL